MKLLLRLWSMVLIMLLLLSGCSKHPTPQEKEIRACWVSSVGNLDFPSKQGLSADQLREEIDEILRNCKDWGINTIFFQVRPNGDALYPSEIFPWSVYLSGKQGQAPHENFDSLAYFIKKAKEVNIDLHGWINPYRIGSGDQVWDHLSADNPAVLHRDYTVTCESGVYYNPALPEVRQLILSGVAELIRNYDIAGIHFDDYFYPYDMEGFDDSDAYAQYGSGLSLEDFRRKSVDSLVESVYKMIKTMNKEILFGISPFGIWANASSQEGGSATSGMSAYSEIFSDSKKWVENGWVDYICPQIYWSKENKAAPFEVLVDWWDALCQKEKIPLLVGIAVYKVGSEEAGWESGAVITEQLRYLSRKESYGGHSFFRYGILKRNPKDALSELQKYYFGDK